MAHIRALHPEDHILGDVSGMVGHSLQITRDQQRVQRLAYELGMVVHALHQLNEGVVAHAIDDVIHFEYRVREFNLALNERLQSATDHRTHGGPHSSDIDGQIGSRELDHIHDSLGDIDSLVAHALEIGIDLGNSKNEAQVHGHWLLHGEKIKGSLIDFAFGRIDEALAFQHHLAAGEITFDISLAGTVRRLLRQSSHAKQPLPQIVKPFLKTRAHLPQPSLTRIDP